MEFLAVILILSMTYFVCSKVYFMEQCLIININFIDEVKVKKIFLVTEKNLKYFSKNLTDKNNSQIWVHMISEILWEIRLKIPAGLVWTFWSSFLWLLLWLLRRILRRRRSLMILKTITLQKKFFIGRGKFTVRSKWTALIYNPFLLHKIQVRSRLKWFSNIYVLIGIQVAIIII